MRELTEEERTLWGRYLTGETWEEIGWYPPVAGRRLSGTADPARLSGAFRDLCLPEDAAARLCPWPDQASRYEAVAAGTLTRFPGAGSVSSAYMSGAAREVLADGVAEGAVAAEIRNGVRHVVARSVAAYITGSFDETHVAAVAAFRLPDGAVVPSGLGGMVPGTLIVLTLWDEVRDRVVAAAEAWQAETADPAGTRRLGECY